MTQSSSATLLCSSADGPGIAVPHLPGDALTETFPRYAISALSASAARRIAAAATDAGAPGSSTRTR